MKKFLSIFLLAIFFTSFLGTSQTANAATVKLNKSAITISENSTYPLKISGTKSKVVWTSSKTSIATVSSKGIVTAKKAGTANIIATIGNKKYICKVTVIQQFNSTAASKNIESVLTDTGKGIIAVLTNNNQYPVELEATVVYMDASGSYIGKSEADNYFFESGKQCALNFIGPYDSELNYVSYSSYKISYKLSPINEDMRSVVSDINIDSNIGADNVMVNVKNNSGKSPTATIVSVVYYKNGVAVGYDRRYADIESPGSEDYLEFRFPFDDNYETIQIDDYKVFVNCSYYYTWEE